MAAGKKYFIVVQEITKPFEPLLFKDLTKYCKAEGVSYDYLKNVKLPFVYKNTHIISRVEVEP